MEGIYAKAFEDHHAALNHIQHQDTHQFVTLIVTQVGKDYEPRQRGLDMLAVLREQHPEIPVIVFSGHSRLRELVKDHENVIAIRRPDSFERFVELIKTHARRIQ